ncbi:hypothetical protein HZB02_01775 [Candidatus Woesearchaeota archaeon]|nr:hypothetical protein [Candidatus Woesearchaeota archaeon]
MAKKQEKQQAKPLKNQMLYVYAVIALVVGVLFGYALSGGGFPLGKAIVLSTSPTLPIFTKVTRVESRIDNGPTIDQPFSGAAVAPCPMGTYGVSGGCLFHGEFIQTESMPLFATPQPDGNVGYTWGWVCSAEMAPGSTLPQGEFIIAHAYCK